MMDGCAYNIIAGMWPLDIRMTGLMIYVIGGNTGGRHMLVNVMAFFSSLLRQ